MLPPGAAFVDNACPINWSHPVNRGLIHWWAGVPNAGWTGGSKFRDLVRGQHNALDGTLTNSPTWQGGKGVGFKALDFANSNQWVNCGTIDLTGQTRIALGVLLYCRSTQSVSPNIRNIAGCDDTGGVGGYFLRLGDAGAPTFVEWLLPVISASKVTSSVALPLNQWVYLLGWYDGSNQKLFQWGLSSGGGQVATTAQSSSLSGGSTTFAIGATNTAGRPFDGQIASVQLWKGNVPNPYAVFDQASRLFPDQLNWVGTKTYFIQDQASGSFTQSLSGSVTLGGALTRVVAKALAGSTTAGGALAKAGAKALVGTTTPGGALAKAAAKPLAGSETMTGALAKATSKPLSGSTTPSGSFSKTRAVLQSLAGAITTTGSAIRKAVSKAITGLISLSGLFSKSGGSVADATDPDGVFRRANVSRVFRRADVSRVFRRVLVSSQLQYQTRTKTPTQVLVEVFSFENFPEILNGATIVSAVVTGPGGAALSGITAGTPVVTTQAEVVDSNGTTVPAGEGVRCTFSGGTAGTDYVVECKATLSDGSAPVVAGKIAVRVLS